MKIWLTLRDLKGHEKAGKGQIWLFWTKLNTIEVVGRVWPIDWSEVEIVDLG